MGSAMKAAVVPMDTSTRVAIPPPTSEEILWSARMYWPEVNEETKLLDAATLKAMNAEENRQLDEQLNVSGASWEKEQIKLVELLVFADDRTQKVMMGYGPRSNVLAVRI